MLVLSRQRDECIMIGDNIVVTIVDIRGDKVRLGINAPTEIPVHRQEVYEAIQRENLRSARLDPKEAQPSAAARRISRRRDPTAGPRAEFLGAVSEGARRLPRASASAILRPMTRQILLVIVSLALVWLLLAVGLVPEPLAAPLGALVGGASSLFFPALLITAYVAPGLLRDLVDDCRHFWHRLRTRGHDVEELKAKIARLDRPYHMHQLGLIYAKQGRSRLAQPLFEQALAKDPDSI